MRFEDLCGETLGRGLYSAFAENYRTLFFDEVPKCEPDLGAMSECYMSPNWMPQGVWQRSLILGALALQPVLL